MARMAMARWLLAASEPVQQPCGRALASPGEGTEPLPSMGVLQAPLFVFLRRWVLERLPTLTAVAAIVLVYFWMVRTRCQPHTASS